MPNIAPLLRPLLATRHGVVTWREAREAGMSADAVRWLVRSGRWRRVHPRVYVAQSGPLTTRQREIAALAYAGGGAVLCCATAAALDGLVGQEDHRIHLSVSAERQIRRRPGLVIHRSRQLGDLDVHPVREPTRVRPARAVLGMIAHAHAPDQVRAVLAAAVQQGIVTVEQLRAMADRMSTRRHHALIVRTLDDIGGGSHSLPELDAIRALREDGVPLPDERQKRFRDGRYYLDLWWRLARLVAEIDGALHLLAATYWEDMLRQNEIGLDGNLVLRYPSFVIRERPELFSRQIAEALARRTS